MIAVDTNVLIDLLGEDVRADAAESCVRDALMLGPVVVCDVVVSEITAGLGHGADIMDVVEEMGLRYLPIERRAAIRAGEMQRRFNQRRKTSGLGQAVRTVPDFLVGAHALLQCNGLITRDGGFFRDYFKGLRVIEPSPV
ncbi:type II toxin-antitoxin system VapC family toxin [Denitratimonas sp. CY0512]|jgi:predicted nucleic acid-binding protein|uniref:type II toxin-antitoxin system VapC family toxin n=1 Tax=Denitratimonas sp. CY0512 TaxID=3131940 RepID=UPI0030ADF5AD|nr:type II toxin-antitoxin system VapC family toxin [Xanthomonadaceae bacterium JHOS43]MCX7563322.1 type II toxin-antitoxin system VapC family toxin [Xanthomonadaceae bacterium XH05]